MNSDEVYEFLRRLEGIASISRKKILLRQNKCDLLEKVLLYAYDPTKRFYMRDINRPRLYSFKELDQYFFNFLDAFTLRIISGKKAKEVMTKYLSERSPKSQILALNIINKDLHCGIGPKLINNTYKNLIPEFGVMLAKVANLKYLKYPCIIQPKIDGIRCIYKDGKFYTRTGKIIRGIDHIRPNLPTLDGELKIPGLPFDKMRGLLLNYKDTPEAVYHVFDIPKKGIPYGERIHMLRWLHEEDDASIVKVPAFNCANEKQMYTAFRAVVKGGYEGLMIKTIDHRYQFRRSYDWMKLKTQNSIDVKVVDVEYGKGRLKNVVASLVCEYDKGTIKVGSGFSDEVREQFTLVPPIGRLIEVIYQNKTAKGKLRPPVIYKCLKDEE